jgi:hypothetical protein
LDPTLTCDRYGISSFIYRARKPFHPKRLFDLIHDKFIVLQNVDQEEEEEEEGEDSGGSEDEDMGGTADENEDMQEDSETEMEDDLAGKDFAREIDPKVTLCLPMNR